MPEQLRGLLDRNVLTILAVTAVTVVVLVAAVAAVTGHYDSASVRAFLDDMKYLAGLLGAGVAVGRGLTAAGQRISDGQVHAAAATVAASAAGDEDLPGRSTGLRPTGADVD